MLISERAYNENTLHDWVTEADWEWFVLFLHFDHLHLRCPLLSICLIFPFKWSDASINQRVRVPAAPMMHLKKSAALGLDGITNQHLCNIFSITRWQWWLLWLMMIMMMAWKFWWGWFWFTQRWWHWCGTYRPPPLLLGPLAPPPHLMIIMLTAQPHSFFVTVVASPSCFFRDSVGDGRMEGLRTTWRWPTGH